MTVVDLDRVKSVCQMHGVKTSAFNLGGFFKNYLKNWPMRNEEKIFFLICKDPYFNNHASVLATEICPKKMADLKL